MSASGREELIGVAFVRDRPEAEMIQGLLRTAGIQSFVKQVGVDGPQLGFGLANPGGGSQQVMVRAEQAEAARALLAEATVAGEPESWADSGLADAEEPVGGGPRNYGLLGAYARIWAWSLAAAALAFAVFALSRAI